MLARLALVFITVPLLELAILVWVGGRLGVLPTVALVVATGILGATLARAQGLATLGRFRSSLAAGRLPTEALLEGVLILVAAAVLLTPGLLTDAVGFALLVPPVRRWVRRRVERAVRRRFTAVTPRGPRRPGAGGGPEDALDVDFTVEEEGGEK